ncbi:hypothetical protein GA0061098_1009131 [Bradyrhizobium shewense]|uniref:Uncharacterized protein n=1 Tax=Bradyrhizobium shewense TaxID=1761772 RepID=A0A1C3WRC5_9BRAD|nr:hypothetical protein GA0061098_1009131 [Bradyrhizobium shewense]
MSEHLNHNHEQKFWIAAILALAPPLLTATVFVGSCYWSLGPAASFRVSCLGQPPG